MGDALAGGVSSWNRTKYACVSVSVSVRARARTVGPGGSERRDRRGHVSEEEGCSAPWECSHMCFFTADSEASHLQLTVPRKLRTNTNNGDLSETHVIKK